MISDYLLTVAGARLRGGAYSNHFTNEHYELNPLWQNAIAQLRWFNLRHLAVTLLVFLILIGMWEILQPNDPMLDYFVGFFIGVQGTINGRHLGNLATFMYIKRHPAQIMGNVRMDYVLTLWLSVFQFCAVLVPLSLIAAYFPRPILIGSVVGVITLILVHLIWIARYHRKMHLG